MKNIYHIVVSTMLIGLMFLIAACGPADSIPQAQPTATINPTFQTLATPMATVPPYRCGAWASNNAPGAYSTITIYARLTKDIAGVSGATAKAVVHFQNNDVTLDQQPTSDNGGYVNFSLPLMGRQPAQTPATVDVTFTVKGMTVACTSAFFTPQ